MSRWTRTAAGLLLLVLTACSGGEGENGADDTVEPVSDVQVNLWEWNWDSVALECTEVLGPTGYSGVQVAPPQDSLKRTETGAGSENLHPWWEVYQPASYELVSRMGDAEQFAAMVGACREAGVKVYVDAVINHMTGQGTTSYGGVTYTKYEYDGLYGADDFHLYPDDCPLPGQGASQQGQISDFMDVEQVFNCDLVGLADLDTASPTVQETIAGYLNELIALGVSGFRVDAAKHMDPADLEAIIALLDDTADGTPAELSFEVLPGSPDQASAGAYTGLGRVLGVGYAGNLEQAFTGNLDDLTDFTEPPNLLGSDQELVFVANHDSERSGSTLAADEDEFALANAFMLAYGYGVPQVYSSFAWVFADDSPPATEDGLITDADCAGEDWICVHRDPTVLGMITFHTVAGTRPVTGLVVDDQVVAFGRGDYGFAAFNVADAERTLSLDTGLPAGDYCDVVTGGVADACEGTVVTVAEGGTAEFVLPPYGAVGLLRDRTG